jgi:hypothetical protein
VTKKGATTPAKAIAPININGHFRPVLLMYHPPAYAVTAATAATIARKKPTAALLTVTLTI